MVLNDEADIATGLGPDDGAGDTAVAYPNNETTAIRIQTYEPAAGRHPGPPGDQLRASTVRASRPPCSVTTPRWPRSWCRRASSDTTTRSSPGPTTRRRPSTLLDEAKADGVDLSPEIRLIGRTAQFPKIEEAIQVIQKELSDLGLNVKIEMMDTAGTVEVQQRPFPEDSGPYLLMIQHGNQAGDAQFSMDQYLLSDGFQSSGAPTPSTR